MPAVLCEAGNNFSSTALGPPNKPAFFYVQKKRQELELDWPFSTGVALLAGLAAGVLSAVAANNIRERAGLIGAAGQKDLLTRERSAYFSAPYLSAIFFPATATRSPNGEQCRCAT